jgi:hypothetical protein
VLQARAARLLTSAVVIPLMVALLLPASFGAVVCRFGGTMAADDCCARDRDAAGDVGQSVDAEPCCSVRAPQPGTTMAEWSPPVQAPRSWLLASAWNDGSGARLARPAAALERPARRALGPPVRLLKQSFLL